MPLDPDATNAIAMRRRTDEYASPEMVAHEWSLTFDAIELPIIVVDSTGLILRSNAAARGLAGGGDMQLRTVQGLGTEEHWRVASELVNVVTDAACATSCHVRDEETGRTWDISASPGGAAGRAGRVVLVFRETTALLAMEESLRRSEKMSAMGELVAGVAHEVRNPLFAISATLDAFEQAIGGLSGADEYFAGLRTSLDRLNRLMGELLEYGKPWTMNLVEGRIEEAIRDGLNACSHVAQRANITLQPNALTSRYPILMDRRRLAQVFQNLIENAIQHSPADSVVEIDIENFMREGRPFVRCVVTDRGPGFRPSDLPRIYAPFFTRRRGGTGLGLSIVQRIVEEHGGAVEAANARGGGAIMSAVFPCIRPGHAVDDLT